VRDAAALEAALSSAAAVSSSAANVSVHFVEETMFIDVYYDDTTASLARRGAWLRQRAQARYRSEPWALRFEDFEHMWAGQWHLRGRGVDNVCMSRVDRDQPWCVENCRIITRLAHAQASSLITHARGQTGPVHKRTFTRV
jgi:hypothetical protein